MGVRLCQRTDAPIKTSPTNPAIRPTCIFKAQIPLMDDESKMMAEVVDADPILIFTNYSAVVSGNQPGHRDLIDSVWNELDMSVKENNIDARGMQTTRRRRAITPRRQTRHASKSRVGRIGAYEERVGSIASVRHLDCGSGVAGRRIVYRSRCRMKI